MPDPTYRALVGDHAFDLVLEGGQLVLDGAPVTYSFEQVAGPYYLLLLDGRSIPVVIEPGVDGQLNVSLDGRQVEVTVKDERALLLERFGMDTVDTAAQRVVRAPMPGLVLRVMVEPGREVQAGEGLLVLEAMKMENELRAPAAGLVKAVHVVPGEAVGKNALLVEFDA